MNFRKYERYSCLPKSVAAQLDREFQLQVKLRQTERSLHQLRSLPTAHICSISFSPVYECARVSWVNSLTEISLIDTRISSMDLYFCMIFSFIYIQWDIYSGPIYISLVRGCSAHSPLSALIKHWVDPRLRWIGERKITHPENCWSLRNHRAAENKKTEREMETQTSESQKRRELRLERCESMEKLKPDFIGLIRDGDESAYRLEVEQLAVWCSLNNLELNTLKTVEMIVDFRRNPPALPPLTIMNSTVTAVESFRFLGTTISQDLKWDIHIDSTVKKAQQRLYFLRQLRKFNLPQELLKQFYSAIIESILCTSITVWFSSATKSDLRRLQRVVRSAERIIGTTLPTLQELYLSRVRKRAKKITLDPSHPAHSLFELLPSGRRYRALSTRTTRHRNSFFPQAIHLMNT
ncbi:hypothetical protein DPX16_0565 [Anabarilius grahami]|uniref:Alkylated DNA repair protein AlkB homologue 8 N-terminal domain-containing protein n=1 Tax=Anabarilius grahami TaxID=495550 RepID=A0A3N0ZAD1_ANAGA|nr:hypothetical protein DPX16_0565 [Anabarilius grahami]